MPDTPAPDALPSSLSRVMVGVLSLLLAGSILVALASFTYGRQAARQAYDRLLLGAANDIAESITITDGAPLSDLPVSAFGLLALAPDDRVTYGVRGPDGTLLTGLETATLPRATAISPVAPVFHDSNLQGDAARFVTVARRFAERDFSGVVTITVGQTLQARNTMALSLTRDALIAAGVAGIALILSAYLVIRSALRPLERVATELLGRDPYDLTPMPTNVPAEVAVMIDAMNRFMRRLDRQMDAMRNLISDTAHQLRTPVAAIRAQAELAEEATDPDQHQKALERLVTRTRSLGGLLDQMLSRALVIHRTDSAARGAVDLRDIALDIVESRDHEVLAPDVEIELVIGPDPVLVLADSFSLGEAARNLLSNALQHGTPPVRIGVTGDGAEARLWVEDAGPGPDPVFLERIGHRFERAAASRSTSAGLGLSIVTAVAGAFDGRVDLAPGPPGFRIALVLPQLPGAPT